jgi:RHS repeat-associated protein
VGNSPLVDYRYALSGSQYDPVDLGAYLPGVSQTDRTTDTTHYLHNDHLGSTWYLSGDDLTTLYRRAVRTGFGQHVAGTGSGPETRYGYAGSWGYQEHDVDADGAGDGQPDNRLNASYATGFPYLHVGARYYDPGSGRFLQRDPIGIRGGLNVYEYAYSAPTQAVDPEWIGVCWGGDRGWWTCYVVWRLDRDRRTRDLAPINRNNRWRWRRYGAGIGGRHKRDINVLNGQSRR